MPASPSVLDGPDAGPAPLDRPLAPSLLPPRRGARWDSIASSMDRPPAEPTAMAVRDTDESDRHARRPPATCGSCRLCSLGRAGAHATSVRAVRAVHSDGPAPEGPTAALSSAPVLAVGDGRASSRRARVARSRGLAASLAASTQRPAPYLSWWSRRHPDGAGGQGWRTACRLPARATPGVPSPPPPRARACRAYRVCRAYRAAAYAARSTQAGAWDGTRCTGWDGSAGNGTDATAWVTARHWGRSAAARRRWKLSLLARRTHARMHACTTDGMLRVGRTSEARTVGARMRANAGQNEGLEPASRLRVCDFGFVRPPARRSSQEARGEAGHHATARPAGRPGAARCGRWQQHVSYQLLPSVASYRSVAGPSPPSHRCACVHTSGRFAGTRAASELRAQTLFPDAA